MLVFQYQDRKITLDAEYTNRYRVQRILEHDTAITSPPSPQVMSNLNSSIWQQFTDTKMKERLYDDYIKRFGYYFKDLWA